MSEQSIEEIQAIAIPAATLIVMRRPADGAPPALLMVERSSGMAFAAGAAVFPGGRVDPGDHVLAERLRGDLPVDEAAARIAAIRETLEETGVAVGVDGRLGRGAAVAARKALHEGADFGAVCDEHGWTPVLDRLVPWARWMPPFAHTRTFDTRFYIAEAGERAIEGQVDATENSHLFWASADEVIRRADADELKVIFPTRRNLERVGQFGDFAAAAEHAVEFPVRLISPRMQDRPDGKFLCLPEGYGYPILEESIDTAMRG